MAQHLGRRRRCRPRGRSYGASLAWLVWQCLGAKALAPKDLRVRVRSSPPIAVAAASAGIRPASPCRATANPWSLRAVTRNPVSEGSIESSEAKKAHRTSEDAATARSLALAALMKRYSSGRGADDSRKASLRDGRSVMDILESLPALSSLSVRDRAFCRLLITTAERRMGQIDKVIEHCSSQRQQPSSPSPSPSASSSAPNGKDNRNNNKKKPARMEPLLQNVLRLGVAQILFARVPAHAAVQETVQLLRRPPQALDGSASKSIGASVVVVVAEAKVKYVNAVLRRVARANTTILKDAGADDPGLNVSPWLLTEWRGTWGPEATARILNSAMQESPRCLTLRTSRESMVSSSSLSVEATGFYLRDDRTDSETRLLHEEKWRDLAVLFGDPLDQPPSNGTVLQLLPQGSVRLRCPPPGPVRSWPLYDEGAWWLQDVSATLPALAVRSAVVSLSRHDESITVVDLCAAPGGKTAQLCDFGAFGTVIAVEKSKARVKRLEENKARLKVDFDVVVADGSAWNPVQKAQAVLLDAPCTASGTASKRPDVLRRSENYQDLVETQFRLACNALENILAEGGILVYATCSLLKQESENQIVRLLDTYPDKVEMLPLQEGELPGFDSCIEGTHGWLRVLPGDPRLVASGVGPCDGFFVARLRKTQ
jgi:16S rRNA (cytosine967-C5)-methyltransferase